VRWALDVSLAGAIAPENRKRIQEEFPGSGVSRETLKNSRKKLWRGKADTRQRQFG